VSLPVATDIGRFAFYNTGDTALEIILPKAAPVVSGDTWFGDTTYTKTVTIKTPAGRTGYNNAWEADFKKTFGGNATITLYYAVDTDAALTGITLSGPSQTTYIVREPFIVAGLTVTAAYNDGASETVTAYTLSWNNNPLAEGDTAITAAEGEQTVTVTYQGQSAVFIITVEPFSGTGVVVNSTNLTGLETRLATAPGGSAESPVKVRAALPLSSANWAAILQALGNAGKYVELDLSACAKGEAGGALDPDGTFSPHRPAATGEPYIVSLSLPDTAAGIAHSDWESTAFGHFSSLKTISGDHIVTIGDYAFVNCIALETMSLPEATDIGGFAFYGCSALETVSLPEATDIGSFAFSNCTSLETVSLPAATTIGDHAFQDCSALETVSLPSTLTTIGSNPFPRCTNLSTIIVAAANPNYKSEGGMLLNKAGTTLIAYPSASGNVSLQNVTTIGDNAFFGCTALETVSLPEATDIGGSAFFLCFALKTVSLPVATDIGDNAFSYCSALETVSLPVATDIGGSAFALYRLGDGKPSGGNGHWRIRLP
jgi:hypothetical protein